MRVAVDHDLVRETERSCTSAMSWTSSIARAAEMSKLCGDSNSSAPNADCARDTSPCVIAVVLAEDAGERHMRLLERLEREGRAIVAGVQDHPDAGRLHLSNELGDRRQAIVRIGDQSNAHQVLSLPLPFRLGDLEPRQVRVSSRAVMTANASPSTNTSAGRSRLL